MKTKRFIIVLLALALLPLSNVNVMAKTVTFSENVYNTSQAISWDMSNNIYNLDFNTDINLLGVYH